MPEGPEIRAAADRVAAAVVGLPLTGVGFGLERLKPFEAPLAASRVCAIDTRGKAMLTRFDCGLSVFSHNQLYGKWVVTARPRLPRSRRQLRFALYTASRWALLYSASTIEVLPDAEVDAIPFLASLGPDCLDPATTPAKVRRRLCSPAFARRRLASLLLDQRFISGLGNYLRSEILFVAGVHPSARPIDCDDAQLRVLSRAIVQLPRRSYATGGITNDSAQVAQLQAEGVARGRYRHFVFRRGGLPCYRCGVVIVDERHGGRLASICPRCQPAP